jgi:FAD/FMN-containing dehydrogenase
MSSAFVSQPYTSWGRVERRDHLLAKPQHREDLPGLIAEAKAAGGCLLGAGLGRSYGDSGLDADGRLICGRSLDRFIALDLEQGVLRAEGGASLDEILRLVVPNGWFLPTTPGTRFVTLGGAVANDVHGKNHHRAGSLGRYVRKIGLIRSDLGRVELSPEAERELFLATLGGLGLTGFIEWVELQLVRIPSGFLDQEAVSFSSLDGFFDLTQDSNARFEHVAAWIDCSASGAGLGRGVMFRANWSQEGGLIPHDGRQKLKVPLDAPGWLLNRFTITAFNAAYHILQASRPGIRRVAYAGAFYPLDAIGDWNRLYGPAGFFQHQCVIPAETAREALSHMLRVIAAAGQGSFLAVLKSLGPADSGGLISFPRAGVSLALDFPNRGPHTLALLETLDQIVVQAGGRLYPAKDGRMSAETFREGYPRWRELEARRDPLFQSAFWRRVSQ